MCTSNLVICTQVIMTAFICRQYSDQGHCSGFWYVHISPFTCVSYSCTHGVCERAISIQTTTHVSAHEKHHDEIKSHFCCFFLYPTLTTTATAHQIMNSPGPIVVTYYFCFFCFSSRLHAALVVRAVYRLAEATGWSLSRIFEDF